MQHHAVEIVLTVLFPAADLAKEFLSWLEPRISCKIQSERGRPTQVEHHCLRDFCSVGQGTDAAGWQSSLEESSQMFIPQ